MTADTARQADQDTAPETPGDANAARKAWMGVLAKAAPGRVPDLLDAAMPRPAHAWLRRPEIGTVMVRGRAGGTGAAFNLGEMTVTRCSLRLEDGAVGHAWVQGRRKPDAEAAAIVDALMQTGAAEKVHAAIVAPLQAEADAARAIRAAKAAATKVDFFTMVRGED